MSRTISRLITTLIALTAIFIFLVNQNAPKNSIYVRHHISAAELSDLQINKWATWKKQPSTFVWQFSELETIVVTRGEVYVTPDDEITSVLIKQGDFATFAPGLRCTWRITQAFEKQVMLADTPFTNLYWRVVFKAKAIWRNAKAMF